MFKRLDLLSEKDFYVLRGPFRSGRQESKNLSGSLLISIFLMIVFLVIVNLFVYVGRIEQVDSNVIIVNITYNLVGIVTILLAITFSVKSVYTKRETAQYLLTVWISQFLFGHSLYWFAIYIIFDGERFNHYIDVSGFKLTVFIFVSYLVGILVFFIHFFNVTSKIEQGDFRKNTYMDDKRSEMEGVIQDDSFKQYAKRIGYSLVGSISAMVGWLRVNDVEILTIATIGVSLFFIMWFILSEQIITWYCMRRFDRFNYESIGDDTDQEKEDDIFNHR